MSKEKKTATKKSSQTMLVKGKLDISRNGIGYVIVEGVENDIVIRPNDFNRALHGDIVRVQINKDTAKGKRQEGKIMDVAERKQTSFIGNIQVNKNFAFFIRLSTGSIEKLNDVLKSSFSKIVFSKIAPAKSQFSKMAAVKSVSLKSAS